MEKDIYLQLLKRMENGGVTELTNLTQNLGWLDKYDEVIQQQNGLYFVSYLPNEERYKANEVKPQRSKDEFVKWISYTKMDLDIRKYIYLHENRIITEEELLTIKDKVVQGLKQDELLSTYTAIIHSGNWIHIYWIWNMVEIDAKTYSASSKAIYDRFKKIFPEEQYLRPDYACGNISSLMRLPGSTNYKKDYGLPPHKVEILEYKEEDSPLVDMLKELWEQYIEEENARIEQLRQEIINEQSRFSKFKSDGWDTFDRINEIPIEELVCNYTGWRPAPNWINFISNRDEKYTGAYKMPDKNVVVHKWTPRLSNEKNGYCPYTFIKYHYANWDDKETFERAKKMYPWVDDKKYKKNRDKSQEIEPIDTEEETIFDKYIDEHFPDVDKDSDKFQTYRKKAMEVLHRANFILFPKEMNETIADDKGIAQRIYKCDLVVEDINYWNGVMTSEINLDQNLLHKFDSLESFLTLQNRNIDIDCDNNKKTENRFCKNLNYCFIWFEEVFGIPKSKTVPYIWFNREDENIFTFSNWQLNLLDWTFTKWVNKLVLDTSIKVSYYRGQYENLTLEESQMDILSLKKYISSNNTVSSSIIWYLIAWIFRSDYKKINNEFPFLWIESITGAGKTSLLNLLSRVVGYDWNTIKGTNDTPYAFEVWLNEMWGWFYFVDEIQKASKEMLDCLQAAYNSGENSRWWFWVWNGLGRYRKDNSIICAGEILPQWEEALTNRFVILNVKEPFLLKKNVRDKEEFDKYKELTNEEVYGEYLTTGQIKILAINYYRPRFLNILRNKRLINFEEYQKRAIKFIESIVNDLWEQTPDARLINNFSPVLAGYMIACWDKIDEEELAGIVVEYFVNLLDYKRESDLSWKMVNYIVENIGTFCNRWDKVKGNKTTYPMIYLKDSDRERGLYMRMSSISDFFKEEEGSKLQQKHIEQQFRKRIDCEHYGSRPIKAAKGNLTMTWVFIPYDRIKKNESLRRIWDSALEYLNLQAKELQKLIDDHQQYRMTEDTLRELIKEMEYSYSKANFFDGSGYSKENSEVENLPF